MLRVEGVQEVHDIHIWTLGTDLNALSCHVRIPDMHMEDSEKILAQIREVLANDFKITHTTVQFERAGLPPKRALHAGAGAASAHKSKNSKFQDFSLLYSADGFDFGAAGGRASSAEGIVMGVPRSVLRRWVSSTSRSREGEGAAAAVRGSVDEGDRWSGVKATASEQIPAAGDRA